ncbi:MAG: Gfo/Idh/MocA family oxidoreductase, partial [Synergistaceae bacterium]|nr:Gfo/Idh/MocA family oxidoreductase [Synergistaceae bacterium]
MKKIKVGIVGLGRLGKVHARNIAYKIPNAELTAACSIVPEELDFAKSELGVTDVYSDYREMLAKADIDSVCIVTTSSEHCWQIEAALDAGKHVFSEKPLGVDVAQCKQAEAAVERHPELTFMLGFMRRYDKSYSYAKKLVD